MTFRFNIHQDRQDIRLIAKKTGSWLNKSFAMYWLHLDTTVH